MITTRRWLSAAAVAAAVTLGTGGSADAYIYWSSATRIGRANLDGSGVNAAFISGIQANWVAVDNAHIFWTDHDGGAIGRANLDGTGVNPAFILGAHDPIGVTTDGTHVYWGNHADGTVGRANVDGTDVRQGFLSAANPYFGPWSVIDVAVNGTRVFWSSTYSEGLGRAGLDGGGMQVDFLPGAGAPLGIDVDATHIYWANDTAVARANLDGSDVVQGFITTGYNVSGVAVDRAHIYWADSYLGKIGRANLDGSGQHWIAKKVGPYGLAVDALGSQAPALRRLRLGTHVARRARQGKVMVRYTDSLAATTTLTVLAARPGGRYVTVRRYRHKDVAGANRVRLSAVLAGHPLGPGRYRLTARPSLAGTRGAARTIAFRIRK